MSGPRETEVKLRARDLARVRAALQQKGALLVRERHFEENVLFDDAARTLRDSGTVLRLRRTPAGGTLTFKGPRSFEAGIKSREERETAVDQPAALHAILKRLGYQQVFRYQKYRESWSYLGQQVELDETPIGDFVEVEGDAEGIRRVSAELGYTEQDFVGESYVGLFFAGGGQGDMVF
jgi:adenylate cyclase class 2